MPVYDLKTKAQIKLLYIQGSSALNISNQFGGAPSPQTITNWANTPDSDGLSWLDQRNSFAQKEYEKLSPQSQAQKILERINLLLQKSPEKFTTKDADALAKLQKVMEKLVDKRYHLPVMFNLLTDFLNFLKINYPLLITPELINSVRHYKNTFIEDSDNVRLN